MVVAERRKLERAEQELARLTTLKETRTVRWNAAAQFDQAVSDWILRGGIPHGCVIESVEGAPVSELMVKNDGGSIETAVQRCRLRLRELAADRHRVNSAQWPISVAEAAARELIERRADAGAPDLDAAIEHGLPISFATTRLTALVHNATPGAVTYIEAEDAVGLICWLFRKELLAKISAGFREIGDDKHALDQQQREEMLATISADSLAAERTECALIWHAEQRDGEIIDFRSDTTPAAVLGLALRTVPRAPNGSSPEHASYNTDRAPGGLRACPCSGCTGAGWATVPRHLYHEPRCRSARRPVSARCLCAGCLARGGKCLLRVLPAQPTAPVDGLLIGV